MANVTGWYAEVSTGVTVPRMSATAVLKEPSVSTVSPFIIAPPRMSATAVLKTPVLGFSTLLTIPRMDATAVLVVPAVSNYVNATVVAPRMAATAALSAPAVTLSYLVTAPRMAAAAAMATPTVSTVNGATYTDNFNRTNSSSVGANWNTDTFFNSSLVISSNAAVTSGSYGVNIYNTALLTGNNAITVVMKGTPVSGDLVQITTRSNSSTSGSAATKNVAVLMSQGGTWRIYRNYSDSGVTSAGSESWAAGDTIEFSAVGSTLTVKRNGSTVLTTGGATDLTAGYAGLFVNSASPGVGFDSFTAQDI